jgi:hypothetical protein
MQCDRGIQKVVPSPDQRYTAIEAYPDCGAMTSFRTNISVVRKRWYGEQNTSVWTARGNKGILLTWKSPTELEIDCDSCRPDDVYFFRPQLDNVKITWTSPLLRRHQH